MTRKPQKMKKWYLLPIALTKRGQRLEGMVVFSTTFFWPKKKRITESMRAPTWSVRSCGRAEKIMPREAPHGPGEHPEGGDQQHREEDACHGGLS